MGQRSHNVNKKIFWTERNKSTSNLEDAEE